ncbi:MAG: hypothetical protein BGN82_09265 [Alphaproteobacteria bacterium 65-7]|nr:MAG: hypothetical protein BGN82_09265 [Alphaproteobacteria bacterium 65-7]
MHRAIGPAIVRDHRNVIGLGQGADLAQFTHAAAPADIGLPDGGAIGGQQLGETVAAIDMLAGGDVGRGDFLAQPA